MLKDLVLRVLNQTVGEYFENIDASQLQLSVFSGEGRLVSTAFYFCIEELVIVKRMYC